jgi:integrase/recombinase XerD
MQTISATVTRFLDSRRKKKGNHDKYPVKLTVYYQGQKKRYKTGVDLSLEDYNRLSQPNLRDDVLKAKRRKIELHIINAQNIISRLEPFTFEAFEEFCFEQKKTPRTQDVQFLFKSYIKELEENEQIGTAISYRSTMNSLHAFKKGVKVNDVNVVFLTDYERHLRHRGLSPSTIGIYMRQLRRIVNVAIKDGLLAPEKYPFKNFAIPASRNIKKALNEHQIVALLNYQTEDNNKRKALDFWLFSYVCNGMNIADICLLQKDQFHGDFFHYFRAKTKNTKKKDLRPIKVPLTDFSRNIMMRWRGVDGGGRFVFPVLREGLTAKQVKYKVQDFIYFINKNMKLVAIDTGIDCKIGTYVARHTHSTVLKRKGVPTEFIKENLGHSSLLTTENYLDDFEDHVKIEYNKLLLDFSLR